MKIGLQVPYFKYPGGASAIGETLKDIAQTAEHAGFYSMWVMDHFFQLEGMIGPAEDPMLEGYTTLGYLAGLTETIKLGTLVTGIIYRYPAFLAKTVTTLDVLSGGRAYLGIGAAWYEREANALGFPFPSTGERFERLEENLQIIKQMWDAENNGAYEGKHYQLGETLNSPQPLSKPHPPIMIGGMGEKKTLRFVAQYADACNLFARAGVDELKHKLEVLRGHCEDVGRDYDEIEKTALGSLNLSGDQTADDVVKLCEEMAGIGISHMIFNMPSDTHDITPLETMGSKVIPAVKDM